MGADLQKKEEFNEILIREVILINKNWKGLIKPKNRV